MRTNEVERFLDEGEPTSRAGRLARTFWNSLEGPPGDDAGPP